MPKRIGFLYEKMADKGFIRRVILEASRGKRKRREVRRVLKNLDEYVDKTYDMIVSESFVPTPPKEREIYDDSSQKRRIIKVVPFWPDSVMHWLLVTVMKPVLMRGMYHWSCASIPGRGGKRVQKHIRRTCGMTRRAQSTPPSWMSNTITPASLSSALSGAGPEDQGQAAPADGLCRASVLRRRPGYRVLHLPMAGELLPGGAGPLHHDLPGVKYMDRYMDNITLRGPNKKQLHKARKLIEAFMQRRLGLRMKENWQIYRTTFTAAVAKRHSLMDARKQRLRRPRMVSAVGYRFSHTHIILRKRNFLRFARQCRRVKKRMDAQKPISFRQASGS